jgi:hypothetical protein
MPAETALYRRLLEKWMPGCRVTPAPAQARHVNAMVRWKGPAGAVTYLLQARRHLATQDAAVIAHQLRQMVAALPAALKGARLLLAAPYIREQQAEILGRAGIDFIDQAGNAHLEPRGLRVDVQGRRQPRPQRGRAPIAKGWVKTAMALLLKPELALATYRAIAADADVALGTVPKCLHDLRERGYLQGEGTRRVLANRTELIAVWVQAYVDRLRPTLGERRLQVKADGKAALVARIRQALQTHRIPWQLTGADAAERVTHHYHAELTEIYAAPEAFDDPALLKAITAQPATRGGNLLVIEAPAPAAVTTVRVVNGVPMAPLLLVYAELRYQGTDQALEAAEMLLPRVIEHAAP